MTAAALAALWASVAPGVSSQARVAPPAPATSVWEEVARGRVARASLGEGGVVAWGVLPLSRELAWLTLTDDHLSDAVAALTELPLHGRWASPKTLYQRIDLPWPFVDRQWVLALENNAGLAAATGAWERSWRVDNRELATAREKTDSAVFDAAETLTVNRGAWLLVPVDASSTLGVYQAWTQLEGNIPAGATETWARASIDDLFAGLGKHAVAVRARYGAGCTPQPGADGAAIPCF